MVTQLFVPLRGIEDNSSDFPGTLQPDSPMSCDSYYSTLAATEYARAHPDVRHILFSGAHSLVMPPDLVPETTEAEAAYNVAIDNGLEPHRAHVLPDGRTTYGNFLEAASWLFPEQETLVFLQPDHAMRGMRIGRFVLPEYDIRLSVVNKPEAAPVTDSSRADRIAAIAYGVGMVGVRAGDRPTIAHRDHTVQSTVLRALNTQRTVTGAVKAFSDRLQPVYSPPKD